MMTDKNQNVVWNGEFLPFGESLAITGTIKNNLRFPGQYYDEETGLHYNWHRDYNPVIGRYIESDPMGLEGGPHLYAYTGNNPINKVDPLGLFTYNKPEPDTGRLKDEALNLANCMEKCMGTTFIVSGGSECTSDGRHVPGGAKGSKHCTNQAFDMWSPGMDQNKVFCCAKECGAKYIENEGNVWHFQTVHGLKNSAGALPKDSDCKCKK